MYEEQARDLLALGPPIPNPARQELLWRAHPGGVVSSVLALGELTLAATSEKLVAAYDERGRRLWTTRFDDVVAGDLRLDPNAERVLLATKDGWVMALDLRTGRVIWDERVATDIQHGIRLAGGRVLVLDAGGAAHVLSAADGSELWASDQLVDVARFEIDAAGVYLLSRSTMFAFAADSGEPRWSTRIKGVSRNAVLADRGQLLVATEQQMVALDPATGRRRWQSGGGEFLVAQDGFVLTGAEQTLSIRAASDGRELASWTLRRDVSDANRCGCTPAGPGAAFIVPSGVVWLR
jgi:outer membrane protein assembly factor BamB